MSPTIAPQSVYINTQGQGRVTCPACTTRFQISAAAYRDLHTRIRLRCTCRHQFLVLFNTREFYRKDVYLPGIYAPLDSSSKRQMIVVNLSMSGIHFRTLLPHTLQVDDTITLIFCLDDKQNSEINHKAVVRWMSDKQIGAEFHDGPAGAFEQRIAVMNKAFLFKYLSGRK